MALSDIEKPDVVAGEEVTTKDGNHTFRVIEPVGEGRCCVVYSAESSSSGKQLALKVFRPGSSYEGALQREQYILENIGASAGCFVHYYGYLEHKGLHCLLQELLDCNIRSLIYRNGRRGLSPWAIHMFAKNMLRSLYTLHNAGFVHGDLKPSNIMWSGEDGSFKLLDFGLSFHISEENVHQVQSAGYQAPETKLWNAYKEMMKAKRKRKWSKTEGEPSPSPDKDDEKESVSDMLMRPSQPSIASDLWSVGCLLVEVATGRKLFKVGEDEVATQTELNTLLQERLTEANDSFLPQLPHTFRAFKDLVLRCFCINEGSRITAKAAVTHKFIEFPDSLRPSPADFLLFPTPVLRVSDLVRSHHDHSKDKLCALRELVEPSSVILHAQVSSEGCGYLYFLDAQAAHRAQELLTENGYSVTFYPLDLWAKGELL